MKWSLRGSAALFGLTALAGCFNPAVSPGERVARACGYYADALATDSPKDRLVHLRDAAHWAELATEKDASYEALEAAFGHITDAADADDDVRPDAEVLAAARRATAESCDEHAPPEVARRVRAATTDPSP